MTDFQPARIATELVQLFTPSGDEESILGDLTEEFPALVLRLGVARARRWYWRQTLKTIAHLTIRGFRTAPWTIVAIVIGGFLLRWYFSWLSDPAIRSAIETVLDKYLAYEQNPSAYIFLLTRSILVERFTVNLLIGGGVAIAARDREMTATMALSLVSNILAIQSTWMAFARTGDPGILWTLPWSFAFSIAVVMGGAIVRTRRLALKLIEN